MKILRTTLIFCFATCWVNLFGQPAFSLSQSTIECGQQTCLQVTAEDFDNILLFQYSMNWDAAILGNATVQSFGIANLSNANFNLSSPGIARIGWDDASLAGISVSASIVLFEICFDEIGGNTATAEVQFSGNPTPIEVANSQGELLDATFNSGTIIINCDEMETGDEGTVDNNTTDGSDDGSDNDNSESDNASDSELAFLTNMGTANCGEQICLDVTTNGFSDISSFQYSLNWDANILGQATIQSFGLPDMDASQFNASTAGILRVGYDDSSLQGRSLADGTVLFQLCFDIAANTSGTSNISFSDNPITIEVVNIAGTILSPNLTNGTLTIACDETSMPTDTTTNPVDTSTAPIESLPLGLKIANDTVNCGNQVCVDVSVQGMTNVTTFRFNTTWDFRLLGNHQIQQENIDNIRFGFVAPGIHWTEWRSPNNQPVTIPDNQIIYSLCFDVPDNMEGSTEIEFVDIPIPILVNGTDGNYTNINLQNGNILVTCIPEDAPDSLSFAINNHTSNCGEQACMSVTAQDFNNMLSFQYSINYNATALGTATIQNFGLPNLSAQNFNTTTAGIVRAGWDDASLEGISVADDHILFDLCFDVPTNTAGNYEVAFSGTPLAIEAVDIEGNILSPSLLGGAISITCEDTTTNPVDTTINDSDNLTLSISEGTVSCGEQICLDVTSSGFTDILSFQYSINWDAAVLGTATVQQFNLAGLGAGNFNTEVAGLIRTGWTDPNVEGITMAEDAVLFQICFDAIGNESANSIVQFSNNPLPIEILDGESNIAEVELQNGNVNVVCPVVGPPTDSTGMVGEEVTFVLSETNGNCTDQICMDVQVNNFTDILSFQYSINWDANVLGQASVQSFNMADLGLGNFNTNTPGELRIGWDDSAILGVSIPDNQSIFQICFDNIDTAIENLPITFSGNPTSIEVVDAQSNLINPSFLNGSLTVICDEADDSDNQEGLSFELGNITADCNTQMCADVRVKGFKDILSFQYSIVWDAAILGSATVQSFGLSDINASNFNTTTPGIIRVGWDDTSVSGISLPDDQLIFQVCFNAVNESIENAAVNFSSTPIPTEIVDKDGQIITASFQNGAITVNCAAIIYVDNDGDGFTNDVDCDDNNPTINPGATEFPNNNVDEDCDGIALFIDADNDGFSSSIDCDDNNPNINGNATEIPDNGIDEDCDGADLITIPLVDNDGDGFTNDVDCDDNNPTINPGAMEFPNNNVDEDCDGIALFIDADNDGFSSSIDCDDNNPNINGNATEIPDNGIDEDCDGADLITIPLVDNDGDGFTNDVDCDDNNPTINPGAMEYPNNNVDEDCDGIALFIDADNDGFSSSIDCDDNNPNINGNATEIPDNGIDEDCDGSDLVTIFLVDNDGDGFTNDVDCDDNNPTINPGAMEYPNNNVDEDCDGIALFIDADNDGFSSSIDCDDNNPNINGNATEIPDNGIDEDCDGSDLVTIFLVDNDGDGFTNDVDCDDNNPTINPGAMEYPNNNVDEDCDGIALFIDADNDGFSSSIDCDDNNPNINGNATEIPDNGIDEDCDGSDLITTIATDNDNDGFNSNSDCDDNNPNINPAATEIPNNGIDEDCNGADLIQNVATDNDNDGFNSNSDCDDNNPNINPAATEIPNNGIDEDCNGADLIQNVATDNDNDGFNSDSDCDDNNPDINPAATEIPNNGIDEDCNGADLIQNVATDNDNDGFNSDSDCDDNNPDINPGATEIPNNGIDEDCNGADLIQNVATDNDNDGFNSDSDCDDNNPDINPAATEIPNNGIDEDCNGADLIQNVATDNDNDGFNSDSDCDDNNPDINPAATEIPNNGIDEDCNGADLIQNVATDNDNDGFNSDSDCDDNNPDINPGATEIPNNGIDEDCNGADLIQNIAIDNDNDGFNSESDCDDNNPDINPGATEIPNNGIDEDCNGADLIQNIAIDNDNDGFNNDSDCDDNNPDINPGATEIPNNGIDEDCNGADLIQVNPDAVTFAFSSETTTCGNQICLNASVKNFEDLISFQYSLNWDTTVLGNVSTQSFNLVGLNSSAFFTPQNGVIRVSWFDTQVAGVTIADDVTIFQICFDIIATSATSTTVELTGNPIPIEVVDKESNEMEVNAVNGIITIANCGNIISGTTVTASTVQNSQNSIPNKENAFAKAKTNYLPELYLYPNPTSNQVNVQLVQPLQLDGTIRVYSIRGQLLQTIKLDKSQFEANLQLGQFNKGVYILEIQNGKDIERRRIIRQ